MHPKDSRVGVGPARGIRGDYVVVTPHKYAYAGLQGPLGLQLGILIVIINIGPIGPLAR